MILGVQDIVQDALLLEDIGQLLRLLNGNGANQHRLALGMTLLDLSDDSPQLALDVFIHHIRPVDAGQGLIGGDLYNVQLVDIPELLLLGESGARHARELVIETEVVLKCDGSQGLGFAGNLNAFFGLNRLVEPLIVPAAKHEAAGKLIHNDNLPILDHIVNIPLHHPISLDCLIDVVGEGGILHVRQIAYMERFLRLLDASGG